MPPVATTPIVGGELGGDAPLIGAAENFVASGYAEVSDYPPGDVTIRTGSLVTFAGDVTREPVLIVTS